MLEFFSHQKEIITKAATVLSNLGMVYLALEMRLGKTLIALALCQVLEAKSVVFLTKKKAMSSILSDYETTGYKYRLQVINYESGQKADFRNVDILILDEAHVLGTYPKPNDKARMLREVMKNNTKTRVIFLSGTPSPESYSQLFHQFWTIARGPWKEYQNFYKWAGKIDAPNYVKVKTKIINGMPLRNYDKADEKRIKADLSKIMLTMDQKTAGFTNHEIREEVIEIDGPEYLGLYETILTEDKFYELKDGRTIVCDTAVKLMQKLHQLWSGTILVEGGDQRVVMLSEHKARYIAENYDGLKVAVYYLFRAEGDMLRKVLGARITESPEEFNGSTDKVFISQIQSGSMGVNLATADILIFMNISFSATHYFQARARTGSHTRTKEQVIHWLFTKGGIESKILKAVIKKKDYTVRYFRKDYGLTPPPHEEVKTLTTSTAC